MGRLSGIKARITDKISSLYGAVRTLLRPLWDRLASFAAPRLAPLKNIHALNDVPLQYRRAFYALPLFVQWIVGLTWDRDADGVQTARRSMALAIVFLLVLALITLLSSTLDYFAGAYQWHVAVAFVVIQGLWSAVYLAGSLFLAWREYRGNRVPLPFIDGTADRLEKLASF